MHLCPKCIIIIFLKRMEMIKFTNLEIISSILINQFFYLGMKEYIF